VELSRLVGRHVARTEDDEQSDVMGLDAAFCEWATSRRLRLSRRGHDEEVG
jgi:hypothetical protein